MSRSQLFAVLLMLGLVAALSGCASIDPAPFNQFKTGLESLRDGADVQAATDVQNARARFITWAKADKERIRKLRLEFPIDSDFGAQYPESLGVPLYVTLTTFQEGLKSLNSAMVDYATLLTNLAADGLIDASQFDQLTKDLNGNATAAAAALKFSLPATETALLSTAAVALFRAALEGQRRKHLKSGIEAVQPQVEAYSKAMKSAILLLATGVTADYVDQVKPLISAPDQVDNILDLNEKTQATLGTLGSMHASYDKLPTAHADLAKAADKSTGSLPGLSSFINEAQRLNTLFRELETANKAAAGNASP